MALFGTMKEPIFLKETSSAQQQLADLKALLPTCPANLKAKLEQDIRNVNAGLYGEDQIAYELKNSHIPMIVLRDLYIKHDDLTAQIDFFIITRQCNILIECKNLIGNIEINNRGEFTRTTYYNGKWVKESIYSPIAQNERHLALLKAVRAKSKTNIISKALLESGFESYNKDVVVLANPKTILKDRYAKREVKEKVIRLDGLVAYIKAMNSGSIFNNSSDAEMMAVAETYLKLCQENPVDYTAKYKNPDATVMSTPVKAAKVPAYASAEAMAAFPAEKRALKAEPVVLTLEPYTPEQKKKETVVCPNCGAAMVKRKALKGQNAGNEFWGCSNYPKCRGIVNVK